MNEGFYKFKKRIIRETIIKSIVFSLSLALIYFFGFLLIEKILAIKLNLWIFILIPSVAILLISFGIIFAILRPTDKKIAIRLDHELNLNEKVQTMVYYKDVDEPIINVQRKDTLDKLSNTPAKKIKFIFRPIYYVLMGLALIVTTTSMALPEKEPYVEPPLPDYDVDSWTIRAIKDLIEDVKNSSLKDDIKNEYILTLTNLLDNCNEQGTVKREIVDSCINSIIEIASRYNVSDDIYEVLKDVENHDVVAIVTSLKTYSMDALNANLGLCKINLTNEENYQENVLDFTNNLGKALESSTLPDSPLKAELITFSEDLYYCLSEVLILDSIEETFVAHSTLLKALFTEEINNDDMKIYIVKKLCSIFDIPYNYEEENYEEPTDPEEDLKEKEKIHPGGMGTGEIIVGSDDIIYDPDLGYVSYSQVINQYNTIILNMLSEGLIDETYKNYLVDYFNKLYGINETEEEQGE